MDLKQLLGENYKPEMSFEDIENALSEVDMVESSKLEGKVDKSQLDKALSEVSNLTKQLRAKKTDEELKEDEFNSLKEQLQALQKEKTVAENKSKFVALGLTERMSAKTAEALVDGDFDTVFANLTKFKEAQEKAFKAEQTNNLGKFKESQEKAFKAEQVKQMPRPESGNDPGDQTLKKGEIGNMSISELEQLAKANPEAFAEYQNN